MREFKPDSSGLVPRICIWAIFQQHINTLNDAAADPWDKPKDDGDMIISPTKLIVSCTVLSNSLPSISSCFAHIFVLGEWFPFPGETAAHFRRYALTASGGVPRRCRRSPAQ
jgi:hypothetical protein